MPIAIILTTVLVAPICIGGFYRCGQEQFFSVVSPVHCVTAISAMLATSVTIMGQLCNVEHRRWLIEPNALVVILIVLGSLGLVFALPS